MAESKPLIGSYSAPDDDEIVDKTKPAPPSAARSVADGIKEDLALDIKETAVTTKKTKDYEEILKEQGISLNEAKSIVDDMLTQGYYEERIKITRSITADFRTRTHADYLRYHNALEALNPRFEEERNELALRYCLAGSIARFNKSKFEHPNPLKAENGEINAAFDERLDWIEKQPERLVALLSSKLNAFDRKVALVMSEGVIENF